MTRFLLGVLAYVVPTFALGFVWHLMLFERNYADLEVYRSDIIIPFGLFSMLIQAVLFAWIYERAFARQVARLRLARSPMRPSGLFSRGVSRHSPWPRRT